MVVQIQSTSQWESLLSKHSVVIADFYADWCGPCKMIAPTFSSLATIHTSPTVSFAKVNVDTQRTIASTYSVAAMPTFLIFYNSRVIETIKGANLSALKAAVDKAVALSGSSNGGPKGFAVSKGHRLGGEGVESKKVMDMRYLAGGILQSLVVFVGLYLVSLFSLDPYMSAKNSPFNKVPLPPTIEVKTVSIDGSTKRIVRPAFKTLADL